MLKSLTSRLFFSDMLRISQACFIPISIAVYLQLKHPLDTTFGEKLGFWLGVVAFTMTDVIYPLLMLLVMFSRRQTLEIPEFKMRFGTIY